MWLNRIRLYRTVSQWEENTIGLVSSTPHMLQMLLKTGRYVSLFSYTVAPTLALMVLNWLLHSPFLMYNWCYVSLVGLKLAATLALSHFHWQLCYSCHIRCHFCNFPSITLIRLIDFNRCFVSLNLFPISKQLVRILSFSDRVYVSSLGKWMASPVIPPLLDVLAWLA